MPWTHWLGDLGGESPEVKKWTHTQCHEEDLYQEEVSFKEEDKEEEDRIAQEGTQVKLSAIHVIKRDILVTTAHSMCGTNPKAKGEKPL